MKKYLCFILTIALLLATFIQVPVKVSAKVINVSPNEAEMVAQKYVNGISRVETGWDYDETGQPIPCYDINGNQNAYIVPFLIGGKAVSYVTVSASKDEAPILMASQSAPPYENLDFDKLGLDKNVSKNPKIIFVEPLDYFIEYPTQNNKTEIYDLRNAKILDEAVKDTLKKNIHTPKDPQKSQKVWNTMLNNTTNQLSPTGATYGYNDLSQFDGYNYDQTWSSYPDESCGPTAAAMILEYWYNKGNYNIKDVIYYGSASNFINHLCVYDFNILGGVTVSEWMSGFKQHSNTEAGYSFTTSSSQTYYSVFKSEIDNNRPVALYIATNSITPSIGNHYTFHWVVGRGYYYDYANDPYSYILINNSWGSKDTICYDEYASYLTSVKVMP